MTIPSASVVLAQRMTDKILTETGPLPERVLGSPDAKITVVEYDSLTCHNCRDSHLQTWSASHPRQHSLSTERSIRDS